MSNPVNVFDYLFPFIAFSTARDNYKAAVDDWKAICDQLNTNGAEDVNAILSFGSVADIQTSLNEVNDKENEALGSFQNFVNNNLPTSQQ